MAQDIRDLLNNEKTTVTHEIPSGHEARFSERLENALPQQQQKDKGFSFFNIAAAVVVLCSLSFLIYQQVKTDPINKSEVVTTAKETSAKLLTLGGLSPNLKKIENYYAANINYELTQMEVSEEGKLLFKSYMEKLSQLNAEYTLLNKELNEVGPNDNTISALIDNLQFKLKLLYELKEKLNELKKPQNNA